MQISALRARCWGSNPVQLAKGDNQVRAARQPERSGRFGASTGVIQANGLGENPHSIALSTLRRPKVLYVSQDPAGSETHLLQTPAAAHLDVERTADPAHGTLADYQEVGGS